MLRKLDVEDEVGVGWDTAGAFAAVGELCGYSDSTLTPDGHAGDAAVPALDHFAAAESKGEWWAFLVGWMKVSTETEKNWGIRNVPSKTLLFSSFPIYRIATLFPFLQAGPVPSFLSSMMTPSW